MRIKITKPGIFGAAGEIAVGTEIDVPNWPDKNDNGDPNPHPWAGRFEVISGHTTAAHVPVNNQTKTVAELLALAEDGSIHHTAFKAEAKKSLGDKVKDDAKKADILAVLFDQASDTELKTYLGAKGVTVTDETRADLVTLAKSA